MHKICVTGGREYKDSKTIANVLCHYFSKPVIFIHGNARGLDKTAAEIAKGMDFDVRPFPADWNKHKRAAGAIRNRQMLDENPELVIAFPGDRGTNDMKKETLRRGIKLWVIK